MNDIRTFTVVERTSEPDPDTYGNVSYFLKLEGVDKGALLRHKKDKPIKNAGDMIEGYYLEEKKSQAGNTYFKLTRPQQQGQGNNGGGRQPKDPAERESIERQVAAKVASDLLIALMAQGTFKPESADVLGAAHTKLAATVAGGIKV